MFWNATPMRSSQHGEWSRIMAAMESPTSVEEVLKTNQVFKYPERLRIGRQTNLKLVQWETQRCRLEPVAFNIFINAPRDGVNRILMKLGGLITWRACVNSDQGREVRKGAGSD